MKKCFLFLLLLSFLFPLTGLVSAEPLVVSEDKIPELNTLVDALALKKDESRRMQVAMKIHFDLNSAVVKPEAAKVLDVLGKAMQADRLLTFKFELEGHTDASGDEKYNLTLSQRRAASVKKYLMTNCGIAEERLSAMGLGEKDPEDPDPMSPANRRVEIYTVR